MGIREVTFGTHRGWRGEAWLRHHQFESDLQTLKDTLAPGVAEAGEPQELRELRAALREARAALTHGEGPDETWQKLHRVEEGIARLATGDLLVEYATWAAHHGYDPALRGHDDLLQSTAFSTTKHVADDGALNGRDARVVAHKVAHVMHHAHAITDENHLEANDRRRRLVAMTLSSAIISLLIVLAAIFLDDLPFLVGTENFKGVPDVQVALLVVLGGLVGGSWGAFPALATSKRDRYRMLYVRATARMSMGVLAALIGVSLVGATWVDNLTGTSAPALFAVAMAFGLTQEPVTKILENKAAQAAKNPKDESVEE